MLQTLLLCLDANSPPVAKTPHALGKSYYDRTPGSAEDSRGYTRTHMWACTHICMSENVDLGTGVEGGPSTLPCHSTPEAMIHGIGSNF